MNGAILMDWLKLSTTKIYSVYRRLFLEQCYVCHKSSKNTLCQHCHDNFPKNEKYCLRCKHPTHKTNTLCGRCQISPPKYQLCVAPYRFEGIIKTLIHSIKFNQGNHYIRPLIDLLSEHLIQAYSSDSWPDQLIYVPSHPNRIKERGFCQTKVMTHYLVKNLQQKIGDDCPYQTHSNPLNKLKHTQAQHSLSRKERLKNKKNTYNIDKPVAKHVALFDDVMTTGSTIESCTKLLLESGAERVDIWVIARTPDKMN